MHPLTAIAVFTLFLAATDGKAYRFDYKYSKEADGWLKVHRVPASWAAARSTCFHEGAVLASPENKKILAAMTEAVQSNSVTCGVFTGLYDTFSKGSYISLEGTPFTRMPVTWAPGEPDNFENSEDCLLMLSNGTMADVKCTDVFPYICYRKTTDNLLNECGTLDYAYSLDARIGSCYKFHSEPTNWTRAFGICIEEGAHLAIINSADEDRALKDLFAKYPEAELTGMTDKTHVYLGAHRWENEILFTTIEGQTLDEAGYNSFGGGNPVYNRDVETCIVINRQATMFSETCHVPRPFVCEKRPRSLLSDE